MVLGSILYRIFFGSAFILGLILTHWQIERAHRSELQADSGRELQEFSIQAQWDYERPDCSQGQYWILQEENSSQILCLEQAHFVAEGRNKYRTMSWNVPKWMDKKNLINGKTEEKVETLSQLLQLLKEGEGAKEVLMLMPELSESQKELKKHRHYAYAVQWLGLALISGYYLIRLRPRST